MCTQRREGGESRKNKRKRQVKWVGSRHRKRICIRNRKHERVEMTRAARIEPEEEPMRWKLKFGSARTKTNANRIGYYKPNSKSEDVWDGGRRRKRRSDEENGWKHMQIKLNVQIEILVRMARMNMSLDQKKRDKLQDDENRKKTTIKRLSLSLTLGGCVLLLRNGRCWQDTAKAKARESDLAKSLNFFLWPPVWCAKGCLHWIEGNCGTSADWMCSKNKPNQRRNGTGCASERFEDDAVGRLPVIQFRVEFNSI